ncbi:DUF4360 domain-containing protein [Streptomyces sp. RB6PN25]|uniref:DUF4360 domain-containing protein n=1 Tax=Streptomyces humicola TaxID=2953240 RepID=A0ABT1PP51_9ACTN|nr:DUF4360 domain-containing protein [Streptomyces humicola]MCQ4079451.1 DUF4360 domain-containing protein [Streptomyces humicola]
MAGPLRSIRSVTSLRPVLVTAAAALLCGTAAVAPASADDGTTPPSGQITINLVTVNGSGCAPDTAAVAISPDNTAFTVTYSSYLAQAGGSSNPVDFRKNCQLVLNVHVPQGFTYAIAEADYRGFASLAAGASAEERANYYFQGMPETAYVPHDFTGPLSDDWENNDSTSVASLVYAPCGEDRDFNINTELRVAAGTQNPSTTSFITMDSTDGSITTTYHFTWKQCPTSTTRR